MSKMKQAVIVLFLFIIATVVNAASPNQVCFTPGEDCTHLIVMTIAEAKQTVYVQAYSFTSKVIADALVDARIRGVDVEVILDKSQGIKNKYSLVPYFLNNHIETWIDYKPAIAHNKVMIIDKAVVITGSFNFTKSAQFNNAENLLIIHDTNLAMQYLANWNKRQAQSRMPLD